METRRQGTALLTALCFLIGIAVVIQIWILSAAVDAMLGPDQTVLLPATIASAALLFLNAALLWYVARFNRQLRRAASPSPSPSNDRP